MGDSDDERRERRDKFRGERITGESYQRGSDRRRDDWQDRGRNRPDYREYRPPARDRFSPPSKRPRGDWSDERGGRFMVHDNYSMYGGGGGGGGSFGGGDHFAMSHFGGGNSGNQREQQNNSDALTQPCMMSLKQFLATQDDSISDSDAITKYGEYKLDFKRQQLNEFFLAHKEEQWFKLKYHPEESLVRKEEQINYLKKRVEVFLELLNVGEITNVTVDTTNTDQLLKLLDTIVIKLEGGTEEHLKLLNEKPVEVVKVSKSDNKSESEGKESESNDTESKDEKMETNDVVVVEDKAETVAVPEVKIPESKKRRMSNSSSSSKSSNDSRGSVSDEEKKVKPIEKQQNGAETEDAKKIKEHTEDAAVDEKTDNMDEDNEAEQKTIKTDAEEIEKEAEPKVEKLEELHKTSSIFLRNLAPAIKKEEIEALCQKYDGFLRVAIADPLAERRWFRRGWITFKREVNIKEICWNLNNIRLRDSELGAIVNRDLSRRIRPVNGITAHKTVCRSDIKLCAKIAHGLDEKSGLWKDAVVAADEKPSFGLQTNNPVLKNITDYLIEEADAEEEELLGMSSDNKEDAEGELLDRDVELISVLDKIILYLRVVHSVDFYNHCEYPYEDEMPNRCGILHSRGPPPQNKITFNEIQDHIKNFENKISQFLADNAVSAEELKNLGTKDEEVEVEKFMTANSQELSKEKWLCPLSGKKFKGPDYIRKHILNKHAEKVDEVRKEVEYFNNYLKDAKRPQLQEHPKKDGNTVSPMQGYRTGYSGQPIPYQGFYGGPPMQRGRNPGFSRGGGRMPMQDSRPVIHYRDLDAPIADSLEF